MPFADHQGARIHWHALGAGEPVVLVMGLGCSSALWFRIAPRLARRHRVILIDNRGSGLTQVPPALVHRVGQMAGDVAAVLDAAGERSAHVVGFSMGGMIAQQLALDHPQRVRSLALLGTHSGGPWVRQAVPEARRLLFVKDTMTPQAGLQAMRPYTYAAATDDVVFDEDSFVRLANQPSARGYLAQLYGLIHWQVYLDLPRLRMRTLVMHGLEDALIPPQNGRVIAERIAGARLVELAGASHWLTSDQTERCVAELLLHLGANAG